MAAVASDPLGLVGQTLEGKYKIDQYVAKGGFGLVYRARQLRLDRAVAVKILRVERAARPEEWRAITADFEEEARRVAQLDHPAIVRVLDYGVSALGEAPEVPWMVTEWVEGITLASDLQARRGGGGRPPGECLALLGPAFDALAYAHDTGIVHRDIKPANLMLTSPRERSRSSRVATPSLKVLDFGVAKTVEADPPAGSGDTATTSLRSSFSARYGAPEQFSGARTGPWTDVHAVALVLTELLTDRSPYEGSDATELTAAGVSARRPTPGALGVDVGAWEPVLAKALALRPADRFASLEEFLRALEAAVPEGERPPVSPAALVPVVPTDSAPSTTGTLPPVTSQTASRDASARRTRMAAVAVAVALLLVGVGVVASTGGAPRPPPAPRAAIATSPRPVATAVVAPVALGVPQTLPPAAAPDAAGVGTVAAPAEEEGDAGRRRSRHRRPSREDGPRPTKQGRDIPVR